MMLTDYFYPHIGGGVEKVVYEVSRGLVETGVDIVVVTINTDEAKSFEILNGIKIYRCIKISLTEMIGAQLTISPSVLFKIIKVFVKEKPDIVHANNRFFFTTICAILLKKLTNKPLITTLHLGSVIYENRLLNLIIGAYEVVIGRLIISSSDKIVAVSKAVKEKAIRLGAKPEKVTVVLNGVDIDEFRPSIWGSPKGTKRVVSVGRLVQNKGVQFIIKAAPIILSNHPSTEFIIVGEGPMNGHLVEMTEKLNVNDSFKFLGTVPSVAEVLRTCHLFTRPSLTEGLPLTVLEAMALGLPVVVSRVSGTPEIILDKKTGILIDPGNIEQLAKAIIELLDNDIYARELGYNAHKSIKERFSWNKTIKETFEVYKKVLRW